jgi:plastocyanin
MVEDEIHKIIDIVDDSLRAREETDGHKSRKREFFLIDKERTYTLFESIARLRGDSNRLKLANPTLQEQAEESFAQEVEEVAEKIKKTRGEVFSFTKKGIKPGDIITFTENNEYTATVVSDRKVKYQEEEYSLSRLAIELSNKDGRKVNTLRGPIFFTHNGTLLTDLPDIFPDESTSDDDKE